MSDETRRRLVVNPIQCDGYGYCAEIVPELITLDEWGFPIVDSRDIDNDGVLGVARKAVATCPRLALLLQETPKSRE